ncbi:hypothetical protein M2132_001796 [Dysgonomonas sp. PH5-45]|uniref:hypothetical protein n=1 Tax=unclassified Dysgonomonas TaxID=2630389 RepID=UPI002474C3ED|nr:MULTISPECIES: hypothetical protein [unclassified Dysgonomonas]MDH6355453.1 hypothetical protein [Dysgonomonas sp. PH5-45]MDH6388350.1 hypothetical protein [Dysgonomonas sp. PH5-37]
MEWTYNKVKLLQEKYPEAPNLMALAKEIGVTQSALLQKACSLKIKRSRHRINAILQKQKLALDTHDLNPPVPVLEENTEQVTIKERAPIDIPKRLNELTRIILNPDTPRHVYNKAMQDYHYYNTL